MLTQRWLVSLTLALSGDGGCSLTLLSLNVLAAPSHLFFFFSFCVLNRLHSGLTQKIQLLILKCEQITRWHFSSFFLFSNFIFKYIKREDPQSHEVNMPWICRSAEYDCSSHFGMSLREMFPVVSDPGLSDFCTVKWCGLLNWMFSSCGFILF